LNHHFSGRDDQPVPVDLLVTGSVPAGSGLSSSAAMVVASTLAFLAVNGKVCQDSFDIQVLVLPSDQNQLEANETHETLDKGKLVQLAMQNEKRVG